MPGVPTAQYFSPRKLRGQDVQVTHPPPPQGNCVYVLISGSVRACSSCDDTDEMPTRLRTTFAGRANVIDCKIEGECPGQEASHGGMRSERSKPI